MVQIVGEGSRVFSAHRLPLGSLKYQQHVTLAHGGILSSQHNSCLPHATVWFVDPTEVTSIRVRQEKCRAA
jgi:hypothetical protein